MKNRIFHMLQKGALLCLLVLATSGCTFLSGLKDRITDKPEDKSAITPEAAPPLEPRETPSGKTSGVAAPPAARDKTPAQAISSQPEADFLSHTVKWKGETLSIIAKWYTGSLDNWKKIAEANPDLDPARIAIGSKIRIPDRLLKIRKPMPKKYIDEFNVRQKIKTESPEATPPSEAPGRPSGILPVTSPPPEPKGKSAIIMPEAPPPPEPRKTQPDKASGAPASPVAREKPPAQAVSSQPKPEKKQVPPQADKKTETEKGPELFGPKDFSR